MWRWPLILLVLCKATQFFVFPPAFAQVSASSSGPVSSEEAALLWKEGKAAFEEKRFQDAVNQLQRLADRYPGHEGYLESHLLLGRAYLELKQPRKAVTPLRYYVQARNTRPDGIQAKLALARAYIEEGKSQEGYLTVTEVEKALSSGKDKSPLLRAPQTQAETLVVKAMSLIHLNHDQRSALALDAANGFLPEATPDLQSEAAWLRLDLKLRACGKLPSPDVKNEAQLRDQIDRKGICMLEAINTYRILLQAGYPKATDKFPKKASDALADAFKGYFRLCANPIGQNRAAFKKHRTAKELERFTQELGAVTSQDCRSKKSSALDLLKSWHKELPELLSAYTDEMASRIEQLPL